MSKQIKHSLVRSNSTGVTKHPLCKVLIQLKKLLILPVLPVMLFDQFTLGQMHDACHIVQNVPGWARLLQSRCQLEEVPSVIQLA